MGTKTRTAKVSDYVPDDHNANNGTERGAYMVSKSLESYGAGRSILVDRNGKVIAGNKTFEAAAEAGFRLVEVETDGNELVVVKRRDLDLDEDARARLLAYADNRASEVGLDWNPDVIFEDRERFESGLLDLFTHRELDDLLADLDAAEESPSPIEKTPSDDSDGEANDLDDAPVEPTLVESGGGILFRKFVVPPFSVLDARQGYWLDRKRVWVALGLKGEEGRDANLTYGEGAESEQFARVKAELAEELGRPVTNDEVKARADRDGVPLCGRVSIFDPVLCELVYRWFAPGEGKVLDPFAGGVTRGAVAAALGLAYTGVDLRAEQVDANVRAWAELGQKLVLQRGQKGRLIPAELAPTWAQGDSRTLLNTLPESEYDLIFTCPPYGDLEQYSDDPADLSAMDATDFEAAYGEIVVRAAQRLKDNRFAVFVVGNVRDYRGIVRDLVGLTIEAARAGRLNLYNDGVLLTPLSSAPMRASRQFAGNRKLVRVHQSVLVFYKGDPARIRDLGEVEAGEIVTEE